jgi:glycosyltransferase involved in cell wall biosynthesis
MCAGYGGALKAIRLSIRKAFFREEIEMALQNSAPQNPKVIVVMPAYNAAKTLKITYDAIPHQSIDQIILVDDGSTDKTLEIARQLQLTVFLHTRNFGYGANQKTCYTEALKEGADIIVMLHPDYQYDPALLPEIIAPIKAGVADIVLGSRFLSGSTMQQGMPWWKFLGNKFLTALENWTLGLKLSEYHTGYRAYNRQVLEEIPFHLNSDKFVFDQELLVQAQHLDFIIKEVPVPTKYFPEASNASFVDSVIYGLSILMLLGRYAVTNLCHVELRQFQSFQARYRRVR